MNEGFLENVNHIKWYQSRVPVTMAEGTRVAQLTESLAKLKEDCLVENQKLSQLADSFNQLRVDNQAFQKQT
jgi:hypothetical protein